MFVSVCVSPYLSLSLATFQLDSAARLCQGPEDGGAGGCLHLDHLGRGLRGLRSHLLPPDLPAGPPGSDGLQLGL